MGRGEGGGGMEMLVFFIRVSHRVIGALHPFVFPFLTAPVGSASDHKTSSFRSKYKCLVNDRMEPCVEEVAAVSNINNRVPSHPKLFGCCLYPRVRAYTLGACD